MFQHCQYTEPKWLTGRWKLPEMGSPHPCPAIKGDKHIQCPYFSTHTAGTISWNSFIAQVSLKLVALLLLSVWSIGIISVRQQVSVFAASLIC